jgi:ribosomal protein S18 acetylase RimI-like enzyme
VLDEGVICQAFDENDYEIGHLAIDGDGKILAIEVKPDYRRRGVATRMLAEIKAAGYRIEHDWQNMRGDGEAWARSLGATPPN